MPKTITLVHIRNNMTGEIRIYKDWLLYRDEDGYPDFYIWEEGNYSCDCNRRLFFARANNENEDLLQSKCGDTEYSVNITVNGECLYSEFETGE